MECKKKANYFFLLHGLAGLTTTLAGAASILMGVGFFAATTKATTFSITTLFVSIGLIPPAGVVSIPMICALIFAGALAMAIGIVVMCSVKKSNYVPIDNQSVSTQKESSHSKEAITINVSAPTFIYKNTFFNKEKIPVSASNVTEETKQTQEQVPAFV